jgi:hypothetical protein
LRQPRWLCHHPAGTAPVNLTCQPYQPNYFAASASEIPRCELPATILHRRRDPGRRIRLTINHRTSPADDGSGNTLRPMADLLPRDNSNPSGSGELRAKALLYLGTVFAFDPAANERVGC